MNNDKRRRRRNNNDDKRLMMGRSRPTGRGGGAHTLQNAGHALLQEQVPCVWEAAAATSPRAAPQKLPAALFVCSKRSRSSPPAACSVAAAAGCHHGRLLLLLLTMTTRGGTHNASKKGGRSAGPDPLFLSACVRVRRTPLCRCAVVLRVASWCITPAARPPLVAACRTRVISCRLCPRPESRRLLLLSCAWLLLLLTAAAAPSAAPPHLHCCCAVGGVGGKLMDH